MNLVTTILSIIAAISAGITIFSSYSDNKLALYVFKPLTTILVIILSVLFSRVSFHNHNELIFTGLVFCLLGDIFLMLHQKFMQGLISFLIAHILFLSFFYLKSETHNYYLLIPVYLIGLTVYGILFNKLGKMKFPVFIYLTILFLMAWSGISFYFTTHSPAAEIIAVAVVLFVFSDANIAFNKFNKPYKLAEFLILSAYFVSIYLIAFSLNFL